MSERRRKYKSGGPRPDRKELKRLEAQQREAEYSFLTPQEKKIKSQDWKKSH